MPFININLDENVKERSSVPAGGYGLTISGVLNKPSAKGSEMLTITIDVDEQEDAMPVKHWLTLPTEGDEEETVRQKTLGVKRFLTLIGLDFETGGFNEEDLFGHNFNGTLTNELVDTDKDGNAIEKPYEINRLQVPFLEA